jgi:hypothetical protein
MSCPVCKNELATLDTGIFTMSDIWLTRNYTLYGLPGFQCSSCKEIFYEESLMDKSIKFLENNVPRQGLEIKGYYHQGKINLEP